MLNPFGFFPHTNVSFRVVQTSSLRAGENVVPEPADEAQEAAAKGAGRAEDARRRGAIRGELERERTEREERAGGAETRAGAGLLPAGGQRRGRRRRGHRGRHLLPGSSTIVDKRTLLPSVINI